jgi:hypothetical protein
VPLTLNRAGIRTRPSARPGSAPLWQPNVRSTSSEEASVHRQRLHARASEAWRTDDADYWLAHKSEEQKALMVPTMSDQRPSTAESYGSRRAAQRPPRPSSAGLVRSRGLAASTGAGWPPPLPRRLPISGMMVAEAFVHARSRADLDNMSFVDCNNPETRELARYLKDRLDPRYPDYIGHVRTARP